MSYLDKRKILKKILNFNNDDWARYSLGYGKWKQLIEKEKRRGQLTTAELAQLEDLTMENAHFENRLLQNLRMVMNSSYQKKNFTQGSRAVYPKH